MMVEALLAKLDAVLDELAGEDIAGVAQRDVLVKLERSRAKLDADMSRRLRESERQGEYRVLGYRSAVGMLVGRVRCARSEAYRRVRVARHVEEMPQIRSLWARGAIGSGHVDVAVRVRHGAKADEHFAAFEASLARLAKVGQPEDLARAGRAWRDALDDHLDRDGSERLVEGLHERQQATWARSVDDLGILNATFAPEAAVFVERALDLAYERGHRANDPRSPQAQRADAILDIFSSYLDDSPRTGNLPHVLVVSDAPTLAGEVVGRAEAADGTRLSPETVRRIACDAFIQRVLVDENQVPLAMGRAARLFTPDQFRAMVVRDGGCRGFGCDAPADRCQSHHIAEWGADFGPTDIDNGALFCWSCHRGLHEGGIQVSGDANGRLEFHARDGTPLGHSEPRTPTESIPTKHGKQRAAEQVAIQQRIAALRDEVHRDNAA